MLRRILTFILIVLLALPLAGATPLAEGKTKKRTETKTFSNNGFITIPGVDIPGAGAFPSPSIIPLKVGTLRKSKILDVNVILRNVNHTFPDDLDVLLASNRQPGRTATVMSDVGGSIDAVDVTVTLDDQAPAPLPDDGPLVNGTFKPTNNNASDDFFPPVSAANGNTSLSVFNGGEPNGQWQLFIADDRMMDIGDFAGGWSIQFKVKVKK